MALLRRIFESLDPSSSLTTDVRFLFKEESGTVKELKAHKLILGAASDVFEREFFGPMKKDEDIAIDDVGQEVFGVMIDYIYNKKIELIEYDLNFLSSLYYLADLYNIKELRLDIITSIPEHVVSDQNVLDVAILAENNVLHQPLSETLYDSAAVFIKKKFGGKIDNVFNFCSETEPSEIHGLVLLKIMARMKNLPNPTPKCGNCHCEQTYCLDGQALTIENFLPGAQVSLIEYGFEDIWTSVVYHGENIGSFMSRPRNSVFDCDLAMVKYKCF